MRRKVCCIPVPRTAREEDRSGEQGADRVVFSRSSLVPPPWLPSDG